MKAICYKIVWVLHFEQNVLDLSQTSIYNYVFSTKCLISGLISFSYIKKNRIHNCDAMKFAIK